MNPNELESLLKQNAIEDNGFSDHVMNRLPKPISHKQRHLILIGSTLAGSALSLFFLPSGQELTQFILRNLSLSSELNLTVISIAFGLLSCAGFFYSATQKEV